MNTEAEEVFLRYRRHLAALCRFDDAAWDHLLPILEIRTLTKNEFLLEEGQTCRSIDFIDQGLFRRFYRQDGAEITTGLTGDSSFITDMKSLSAEAPANVYLQALKNSVLVRLYKSKLIGLYGQCPELQAVGRAVLEAMLVQENEWKEMYTLLDGAQRYAFLRNKAPQLLLQVPLQYIASFLGLRRETLSRIRARKK